MSFLSLRQYKMLCSNKYKLFERKFERTFEKIKKNIYKIPFIKKFEKKPVKLYNNFPNRRRNIRRKPTLPIIHEDDEYDSSDIFSSYVIVELEDTYYIIDKSECVPSKSYL